MSKLKVLVVVAVPQVAAFYVVRGLIRHLSETVSERVEGLMDGVELAVLDELASWEAHAHAPEPVETWPSPFYEPDDDRLGWSVTP